jgi:hypothetical protein
MLLRHLAEAERHIALGERHVADQERLVADLEAYGYDTTAARSILMSFRLSQALHVEHRENILKELEQ